MEYNEDFKKSCILLGKSIQQLRELKNITLKEMSQKTNISVNYLKKIENGNAYGVRLISHLQKIANALDTNLHQIFLKIEN